MRIERTSVAIVISLICLLLIGCTSKQSGEGSSLEPIALKEELSKIPSIQEQQSVPTYTVIKDRSYEDAGTAKVIWEILVPSDITKESLTTLLNNLYSQAQSHKFRQHNTATVIDIKAYISRDHAESGFGQWIAWMSKTGLQSRPDLKFNDAQISQLGKKPEHKVGLSEKIRKQIFYELVKAEDDATNIAMRKYPDDIMKQIDYENSSRESGEQKVREKYNITKEQMLKIKVEGVTQDWPLPRLN